MGSVAGGRRFGEGLAVALGGFAALEPGFPESVSFPNSFLAAFLSAFFQAFFSAFLSPKTLANLC